MKELLSRIEEMLPELTSSQRKVAAFILENYNGIPFFSVTSMAKQIGVSDTTIIKFCTRLGFSGFSSFKRLFSEHIQSEMTMDGRLEEQLRAIGSGNTLDRVLAFDINNLQATLLLPQNRENFDRFVSMIEEASRIHVFGFRASAILAEFMCLYLRQLDYDVQAIIPGLGEYADKLSRVGSDDLCIPITFTRYSSEVYQGVQLLKEQGVRCALITDSVLCPCYPLADTSLLCQTKTFHHALSYVGFFSLMNAIITATSLKRKDQATQHIKRLEDMFLVFKTFHG